MYNLPKSLLSIQSHVVHGYVGGKAAIFPLQCQGWDVDAINTVNFSNHTGYGSFKGTSLSKLELEGVFEGITDIGATYNAIITGYIPNDTLISSITSYIKFLKDQYLASQSSPFPPLYLLDPVMGDQGYLYVDKSCIVQYKNLLATKLVDIITPNQFELELLCDKKITNLFDLNWCINHIHSTYNVKYVVVTSLTDLEGFELDYIYCAISLHNHKKGVEFFKIPIIKSYFTGVGDLFSALLLDKVYANLHLNSKGCHETISEDGISKSNCERDLFIKSVNQVLTIMSKTLKLTHSSGVKALNEGETSKMGAACEGGKLNEGDSMKYFELKIIQSKEYFKYSGDGEYISQSLDLMVMP